MTIKEFSNKIPFAPTLSKYSHDRINPFLETTILFSFVFSINPRPSSVFFLSCYLQAAAAGTYGVPFSSWVGYTYSNHIFPNVEL